MAKTKKHPDYCLCDACLDKIREENKDILNAPLQPLPQSALEDVTRALTDPLPLPRKRNKRSK